MELSEICQAITTSGNPCKKKSKKNACFCSTHLSSATGILSGTGITENQPVEEQGGQGVIVLQNGLDEVKTRKSVKKSKNTREVEIREIRGIPYYIDGNGHVYKHEEIQQDNPSIIGHFNTGSGFIDFVE